MKISLCMIAKNEEHCIGECLASVRDLVSEIIIVDTGSTDKTIEIAREFGAKIIESPWRDDFAFHRNEGIEVATGDWILVLDADEALNSDDFQTIKNLINEKDTCFELTQRHYTDDHRLSGYTPCVGEYPSFEKNNLGFFESSCVRLFPNHPKLRYRNKIHELVEPSIAESGTFKIRRSGVRIHHYGHTEEIRNIKNKHSLYGSLGEKKIVEDPTNWQAFFELGVEYNVHGDLEKSIKAFERAAELNPNYVPLWVNKGYVNCELGRYEAALEDLKKALSLDPKSFEAYGNMGVVFLRIKQFEQSVSALAKSVELNPNFVNGFANMARAFAHMGKLPEASLCFERALLLAPGNEALSVEYATLLVGTKLYKKAEAILSGDSADTEVLRNYARMKLGKSFLKPKTPPSEALKIFYEELDKTS